ncbi:MAG: type II secretion system protein J [Myxococcota bacterium]
MRSGRAAGFTLLEMLIAIGITALVVTVAIQVYLGLLQAQERALGNEGRTRAALVLLDRIASELSGTLLIVKPEDTDRLSHPYFFVGEDRVLGTADADAIRFVTLSPARPAAARGGAGVRMISYATEPRPGEGFNLLRAEEPLPDGLDTRIRVDEGQVVAEQLALFSLRFRDEDTGDWRDYWNSTDIARLDLLPASVEVRVRMLEQDASGEPVAGAEHTRVVELRIRPIEPGVPPDQVPAPPDEDEEEDEEEAS